MIDALSLAARLRGEAGVGLDQPVDLERVLARLYNVGFRRLPGLSVHRLRAWLERHNIEALDLAVCQDRRLRGGIVARRGKGILIADEEDSPEEIRFTFAHEAAHFLGDHVYLRRDLERRLGPEIRPVLDGLREPTRGERVEALLARTSLTAHVHLMARDGVQDGMLWKIERTADEFAREILAPRAALEERWGHANCAGVSLPSVDEVEWVLVREFKFPPVPAREYARAFVLPRSRPPDLLQRMGLRH